MYNYIIFLAKSKKKYLNQHKNSKAWVEVYTEITIIHTFEIVDAPLFERKHKRAL